MSPVSSRKMKLTVNGKSYSVEVGDLSSPLVEVVVDGRSYMVHVEMEPLKDVPMSETAASPERRVRQSTVPERVSPPGSPSAATINVVKAPMPGDIVKIFVKPGDKVSYRQPLCLLESMKMNNPICSPRDGVIASVEVAEGKTVAYGELLFTFE